MSEDKTVKYWYHKLEKLMWAMVWDYANPDRWRLEPDELFGELSAELVEVVQTYQGQGKSEGDMYRLITTSLRNRCRDIACMEYNTHRRAEAAMESLDNPDFAGEAGVFDSHINIELLSLSNDAARLVDEVLNPSERYRQHLELVCLRKQTISSKGHWKLHTTPWILQRSLGWGKERFESAWKEVATSLSRLPAGSVC